MLKIEVNLVENYFTFRISSLKFFDPFFRYFVIVALQRLQVVEIVQRIHLTHPGFGEFQHLQLTHVFDRGDVFDHGSRKLQHLQI